VWPKIDFKTNNSSRTAIKITDVIVTKKTVGQRQRQEVTGIFSSAYTDRQRETLCQSGKRENADPLENSVL
jgi:hypothetical protein